MNLLARLLVLLAAARFRSPVGIFGPCVTPFRCLPTDLDVLRHMNNAKYFSLMDLARVDLMIRSGLSRTIAKQRWYPVVASETIRFFRSLTLFQTFNVETTVLGWDDHAFLIAQRFVTPSAVAADAVVRARFLKRAGGTVTTAEFLSAAGVHAASPVLPDWVAEWNTAQKMPAPLGHPRP
jgi:acyl-CoA thioesterase FadM